MSGNWCHGDWGVYDKTLTLEWKYVDEFFFNIPVGGLPDYKNTSTPMDHRVQIQPGDVLWLLDERQM